MNFCRKTVRMLLTLHRQDVYVLYEVDSSWKVMANGDAREGKWRGNWRMECVASTLHTTSEHGVSSITTADAHTSAASSRMNWRPRRFKRTRLFHRKTRSGFCACAITFQTQSNRGVSFILSSDTEALSHRKSASTEKSRDICCAYGHYKRET